MLSKAEQLLLDGVRQGDPATWQQFVDRFQGRLLSYAVRALNGNVSDAEDLVQDVFIAFLKGVDSFEGRASLESWLFMILRRRMIDLFRKKSGNIVCLINDLSGSNDESDSSYNSLTDRQVDDMTASRYARNVETSQEVRLILASALDEVIGQLKARANFRDIMLMDLIFYAGIKNKKVAELLELDAKTVGVIRHRLMDKLKSALTDKLDDSAFESIDDGLLNSVWQESRFTCPKRSTIGSWKLGSLDDQWSDYVRFHIEVMGCTICKANLDDLENELNEKQQSKAFAQRVFESSIGFFN